MKFQERYEDFLMHYGVKGMQWGKRSAVSRVTSANSRPSGRKRNVVSGTASGGYRRGSGLGYSSPVGREQDTKTAPTRSGPVGRKRNVVPGAASGGYRRGSGLGTGPVGQKPALQAKQQNAKKETNAEYFKRLEEERKQTEKALRKLNNIAIAGNNASIKKAAENAWVDLYLAANKDLYDEYIYDNPSGTFDEERDKRYNQAAESLKAVLKAQKMDKDAQKTRRKKNFENNIMRKVDR